MGTNGPKFDKVAHYAAKTVRELQEEKEFFEIAMAKHAPTPNEPANAFYADHIEYLRLQIAERIINKK